MNAAFDECKRMFALVAVDFPTAILSGGAVRDAIVDGSKPKDFDFFIPYSSSLAYMTKEAMDPTSAEIEEASLNPGRVCFVVQRRYDDKAVDLVFVPEGHTWLDILEGFDIDLCRVAIIQDLLGMSLVEGPGFNTDLNNKTVTNHRNLDQSRRRMGKIAKRFGFTAIDLSNNNVHQL